MVFSTKLPPGFGFNPTNEVLVMYYLKRKVLGKRISDGVISELDIYKYVPWDLPNRAFLQSRDLNWYFLCPRPKKRGNSGINRRVIGSGYWKITGNGRPVQYKGRDVGEIKSLMYYHGKSRKAVKTEWTMHEFRLNDSEVKGVVEDSYVLCRIFKKSGSGPKNGEQYGAPFEEEEWEDDDDDDDGDGKKDIERIGGASLTKGPSAGSENQQGPPAVTAGILLEGTDSPSCSYNHQEGLAAATGIFEVGNHDRIDYDNNAIVIEQLWDLLDNNNVAVQVSEGPQGQSSPLEVCDANTIGVEELLDTCPDADMLQVMQCTDDICGLFDGLEELEELFYPNP